MFSFQGPRENAAMGRVRPRRHTVADPNGRWSSQDNLTVVLPSEGRRAPKPGRAVPEPTWFQGCRRLRDLKNKMCFVFYKEAVLGLGRASSHRVSQLNRPAEQIRAVLGGLTFWPRRESTALGNSPLWCQILTCPIAGSVAGPLLSQSPHPSCVSPSRPCPTRGSRPLRSKRQVMGVTRFGEMAGIAGLWPG